MTYSITNSPLPDSTMSAWLSRPYRWEYKTIQSKKSVFRNPSVFQRLCENEAQSGWVLIEKLDDQRVRFKRAIAPEIPMNTRNPVSDPAPEHLDSAAIAPQPTWLPAWLQKLLTVLAFAIAATLPAYLGYALMAKALSHISPTPAEQIHAR